MISRLIFKALSYNMDAHRANPVNLAAGAIGMIVNNMIFLLGIWGMIFAGKPANSTLLPYFIALNAVVMTSWGLINFFFGGLKSLGEIITEGALEPMMATPRDPVLLSGISRSHPVALGDFIMGLTGIAVLAAKLSPSMSLRCLAAAAISIVAFAGLFISAGALSFFIARGSHVGELLVETTVSLSVYPSGKIFNDQGRILLLLTPAAATAILPMDAVENAGPLAFLVAFSAALAFFRFSLVFFRIGIRRYRTVSLIGPVK